MEPMCHSPAARRTHSGCASSALLSFSTCAPLVVLILASLLLAPFVVSGLENCERTPPVGGARAAGGLGGSFCPDGDTCCPLGIGIQGDYFEASLQARDTSAEEEGPPSSWACVPGNKHLGTGPGVCCPPPVPVAASTSSSSPSDRVGSFDTTDIATAVAALPTGCPPGYRCAGAPSSAPSGGGTCERIDGTPTEGRPPILPRYVLCSLPESAIGVARGFPVRRRSAPRKGGAGDDDDAAAPPPPPPPELAYYSSDGRSILDSDDRSDDDGDDARLRLVVIVVHGSGRNADDYLCALSSTVHLQTLYRPEEVLFLAPRFLVPDDGPLPPGTWAPTDDGAEALRWDEHMPIAHTWRYGADAMNYRPFPSSSSDLDDDGDEFEFGVSSFEAMDRLVEHFVGNSTEGGRYPALERVVVAGHSAGGQFAQRWALTSISSAWGDVSVNDDDGFNKAKLQQQDGMASPMWRRRIALKIRGRGRMETNAGSEEMLAEAGTTKATVAAVAANPRSYAYPDPRRYLPNGTLAVPPDVAVEACPGYDEWEWGLQAGGPVSAPYKDRSVISAGGREELVRRFGRRDVTYLGGTSDTLPLHGSCEDDGFQGPNRLERGRRYFAALEDHFGGTGTGIYGTTRGGGNLNHRRWEVRGSPHDHALMFQSLEGVRALFGGGTSVEGMFVVSADGAGGAVRGES